MADSIKIVTANCRGLAAKLKRVDVFNYWKSKGFSIICLQDTHTCPKMEDYIKDEWGHDALVCPFKSNARGVIILFNNNFEYKINRYKRDTSGNYIIVDLSIQGENVTLINIYGPNKDSPEFYTSLKKDIQDFANESVILCGDFNLVQKPECDTLNYVNINNPQARKVLLDVMKDLKLEDIWRTINPDVKGYTWQTDSHRKQARLDYFLVSERLIPYINQCKIISGYKTDHSAVSLELIFLQNTWGKGYWKFNNTLLKDKEYIDLVKRVIKRIVGQYAIPIYNEGNLPMVPPQDIAFTISDQLFLDVLLMELRGATISHSSWKKKEDSKKEKQLEGKIQRLEEEITNRIPNIDLEQVNQLKHLKEELESIREVKIQGSIFRSKAE